MHVVAIHGWQTETPQLVQALAGALGILPFEAHQRLIVGSPAVVAGFAEAQASLALAQRLSEAGLATVVVDSSALHSDGRLRVETFALGENSMLLTASDGVEKEIPYAAVELLLFGVGIVNTVAERTVTGRKFSLGKTLLAGGLPMTSKVTRLEEVVGEERSKHLYLYLGGGPPLLFGQLELNYAGLGTTRQLTREANYSYLLGELRRRCSNASYDERLLNRSVMTRMLGTVRGHGSDLDLAAAILASTLNRG